MVWVLLSVALLRGAPLTANGLVRHMRDLEGATLLVDGNNVRGADCFFTSQQALSAAIEAWSASVGLEAILVLDHGDEQRACRTGPLSAVTFAGPGQTADDLIVRDSLWLRSERKRPVVVVTSDAGLVVRVKQYRSCSSRGVQMVPSATFAKLLLDELPEPAEPTDPLEPTGPTGPAEPRSATPTRHRRRGARDREAEAARRKETTAMRAAAAAELLSELMHEPASTAGELSPLGLIPRSLDARPAPEEPAPEVEQAPPLLDAYVRWVNEEAPRGRRHADPVGLAPSPSMKRRLRRKRHRDRVA